MRVLLVNLEWLKILFNELTIQSNYGLLILGNITLSGLFMIGLDVLCKGDQPESRILGLIQVFLLMIHKIGFVHVKRRKEEQLIQQSQISLFTHTFPKLLVNRAFVGYALVQQSETAENPCTQKPSDTHMEEIFYRSGPQ